MKRKYKIGDTVKVTQRTQDHNKVCVIESFHDSDESGYYNLIGTNHPYDDNQIELISSKETVINDYLIY